MNDDRARLDDILRAASRIEAFVEDVELEAFQENDLLQSAVIFQLLIIGEAAKHLSEDFRETHKEIPWSKMARMRDRLIHGYFDLDLEIVWETATRDIEHLLSQLEKIVE